ncbi:hypothetical protein MMC27_007094 [Xylographa pallens]|nr:hypothetical protein [Xylographa pallens]
MALLRLGISKPKKMAIGRAHSNSTESGVIKVENTRHAERIVHDEAEPELWGSIQPPTKKLVQVQGKKVKV